MLLLSLTVAGITHAQSVDGISGASQQISKNQTMKGETVICRGKEAHTAGKMLAIGKKAPDFKAVNGELAEVSLSDYRGKRVILNIFPSLDTPPFPYDSSMHGLQAWTIRLCFVSPWTYLSPNRASAR